MRTCPTNMQYRILIEIMSQEFKKKSPWKQLRVITTLRKSPKLESSHREKQTCQLLEKRENCLLGRIQNNSKQSFTTHRHYLAIFTIFSHIKENKWLIFHVRQADNQRHNSSFSKVLSNQEFPQMSTWNSHHIVFERCIFSSKHLYIDLDTKALTYLMELSS